MNHGDPPVSTDQYYVLKDPFLQSKNPCCLRTHEASGCPVNVYEYISSFGYPEEQKTLNTAWEYYNEGTSGATLRRHMI